MKGELSTKRECKNAFFHELYEVISKLLLNGHFASFIEHRYESLIIAEIDHGDPLKDAKDKWHIVIEYSIAEYLDVCGQFLLPINQFEINSKLTSINCYSEKYKEFTIRSAGFEGANLILSKKVVPCFENQNIIYGIRCRECSSIDPTYNVSYVGKTDNIGNKNERCVHDPCQYTNPASLVSYVGETENKKKNTRSVHDRVCKDRDDEYWKYLEEYKMIEQQQTKKKMKKRYMHLHIIEKHKGFNFHNTMEMIYLPLPVEYKNKTITRNDLYTWECFWQFFCRANQLRGGWCASFPGDPIRIADQKANKCHTKKSDDDDLVSWHPEDTSITSALQGTDCPADSSTDVRKSFNVLMCNAIKKRQLTISKIFPDF